MSCENTNARLQIKYTTVAGQVPSIPSTNDHNDGTWNPTDIYIGEFFLNSYDDILWVRTLDGILAVGGTGGSASFIGDFVSKANGGTYSGPIFAPTMSAINMIATTISASAFDGVIFGSTGSTYYGDGSNLTGITTVWNGGTVALTSTFNDYVEFQNGLSVGNISNLGNTIYVNDDTEFSGGVSASYFIGDGALLTNLPIGPTANYYTTNAYLDGNIIRYDRTDLADAYSVDISPILFTQSVAGFTWDSATNDATLFINDGSFFSINLGIFNNISTAIINATDVYASNFYGTFNGTYSNDIYTISATLSGTTAVFDRTDGITYSLDLSSIAGGGGGGTQSLAQTLVLGNETGVNDIILSNSVFAGTSDNIRAFGNTLADAKFSFEDFGSGAWAPTIRVENGNAQNYITIGDSETYIHNSQTDAFVDRYSQMSNGPTEISLSVNDLANGEGTDFVMTSTSIVVTNQATMPNVFPGIQYDIDYSANFTNRSLVDKEYVDNLPGAQTLEQTLQNGNTIGIETINFGGGAYIDADGTNVRLRAGGNVSGDSYLNSLVVADDFTSGIEQISFSDISGVQKTSNFSLAPGQTYEAHTINDIVTGTQQSTVIEHQTPKTVELIVDQSTGVDTEYRRELGVIGTTNGSSVKVTDNNSLEETQIKTSKSTITLSSSAAAGQTLTNIGITASQITYSIVDTDYYDPYYSATGSITKDYTSLGNDYIAPNPGFPDFHRRGSVNTKSAPASGNQTWAELWAGNVDDTSVSYIRATDMGGAYPANVLYVGGSGAYYSQIEQGANNVILSSSNPSFEGIKYDTDWSANFVARSLVDKAYVDAAVGGIPGTPTLSAVLLVGNAASANIDMAGYDITSIQNMDAMNVETTNLYADATTAIETINIINMANLALMYNT